VLRVELDEMKSRPSLLGACTSCPVLHEKLGVSLVYARSLEAQLKAPIPRICSTCEINVVKNMELAHYVDRLQDENDGFRKLMGWLSRHEPQLRIMIETYKHQDGEALGANKVGEGSGENEGKIGDILEPPKTHHKNAFVPKPNHLRNRLDTTLAPPIFPSQTDNFQKPIKFKSDLGNEFFGSIVGGMGTLLSFASGGSVRRGWLESWPTRTSTALLVVCLNLSSCREVRVWCVQFTLERGVSLCLVESHHIEEVVVVLGLGVVSLLDVPLLVDNTRMGGNDRSFRSHRSYGPQSPLHGTCSPPRGRVGVPPRRDSMDFTNPAFEQMARHWFDSFCTNPSVESFAHSCFHFYFTGGRHGGLFVDRLRLLSTHDRRSIKEYITFGDNWNGRVLSVGTVKVSESVTLRCVSLVKSLGYNLLSVSQLLDEGFEVCFKTGCSRVLDSRGDLVCTIVPKGQIFRAIFSQRVGSSRCLVAGVLVELWKWHRRLGHLSFDLLSRLSGLGLAEDFQS
jgi:hypothetical protein